MSLPARIAVVAAAAFLALAARGVCSDDGPTGRLAEAKGVPSRAKALYIGEMTPFWRNQPIIGRWLIGGGFLKEIPDYWLETSFPYQKRPYATEVPFANHLSVVRLLGGWDPRQTNGELGGSAEADLAYRDAFGDIQYRWELLAPRLDPYVNAGYNQTAYPPPLTIVLDNTPWCFPDPPVLGSLGQIAPPADFDEWKDFIAALCQQLVSLYGYDVVSNWRFRMGTECSERGDDPDGSRFWGTEEQYLKLYDHAAAGVKSVVPDAQFGPFNTGGASGDMSSHNVNPFVIAKHCLEGTNFATHVIGGPFDFAAISQYSWAIDSKIDFWDGMKNLLGADLSTEIHEFGILFTEDWQTATSEPGARGAAWKFHITSIMREHGHLDRLFHWGTYEVINVGGQPHPLTMTSGGWLYSILDYTVGGDTYVLDAPADSPEGTQYRSMCVVTEDRRFIITSVFNLSRYIDTERTITISVPKDIMNPMAKQDVQCVYLTRDNSFYDVLRRDLETEGFLLPAYSGTPGVVAGLGAMVGGGPSAGADQRAAFDYVRANWATYEQVIKDSLTLKPFPGTFQETAADYEFTFDAAPPMVMAIVVPAPPEPRIDVVSPNGGEARFVGRTYDIVWTTEGAVDNVSIEYSTNGGGTWTTIAASAPNDGTHPWTVPATPSDNCLVRISDAADGDPSDLSDATFTITDAMLLRVTGIGWSNDCTTALVSFEANKPVQRYYYRLFQTQSAYLSTSMAMAPFMGLGQGYYLVVVTARDQAGFFAPEPARVWFYNKPVGEDYQVYVDSYTIDHDGITFNLAANRSTSRYYARLYGVESGYTANAAGAVTYSGLEDGLYYFVATGREAATGNFPTVPPGPARQFFYIVTDGF